MPVAGEARSREQLGAVPVIQEVGIGDPTDPGLFRLLGINPHDIGRVLVGKGMEEKRVDDAEDGGVGADAEGQGEDGDGREGRVAGKLPQRIAQILDH